MNPARLLIAVEVLPDEVEDFEDSLKMWMAARGKPVRFAITHVALEDENGQTDEGN